MVIQISAQLTGVVTKAVSEMLEAEKRLLMQEVAHLCNIANLRLERLEKADMTSLPGYSSWQEAGSVRFSVVNKTPAQVQEEFWRVKNFLEMKTSTVRGGRKFVEQAAQNTGLGALDIFQNASPAQQIFLIQSYFNYADLIKHYLLQSGMAAEALAYMEIWEQVNQLVQTEQIDLWEVDATLREAQIAAAMAQALETAADMFAGWFDGADLSGGVFPRFLK